ncbi:MAG: NAD(P)H-hydrate dehydratase, partial [Dehalococcoidia bacterium]
TAISPWVNPGMATGGTGDVLAGLIAGFLAQGMEPFDAAALGVYAHGLAGEIAKRAVGEVSMVAGDVLESLPAALKQLSN